MKIKPLFDRVLLKPTGEKVSDAGVYIPHDASARSQIMTVIAVGTGTDEDGQKKEMIVTDGEKVIVSKYAGTEVVSDNEKFWILKQCDILAKIE